MRLPCCRVSVKVGSMRRVRVGLRYACGVLLLCMHLLGCTDEPLASDAFAGESWSKLVEAAWSLPPGEEAYICARLTLEEDLFVRALRADSPPGTHHSVLSLDSATGKDGTYPCTAATNGQNMLFGAGVGTQPVVMPDGVALKLPQGSAVILNLHLFNVSSAPINASSGIEIVRADPSEVVHEAEIVLAGKAVGLIVPPGASVQTGSCEMSHDVTLFAVFPHMHQLGTHLKAIARPSGAAERVLLDAPYSFDEQLYYPVAPELSLSTGDAVDVECSYENPGAESVLFGDSSLHEMCFAGLYRYPRAANSGITCTTGSGGPTLNGPPCAEPGAPGNELGVGRECSEGGGECSGDVSLCLLDYTEGEFGNFCTRTCDDDTVCGSGAICLGETENIKICLPTQCLASLGG